MRREEEEAAPSRGADALSPGDEDKLEEGEWRREPEGDLPGVDEEGRWEAGRHLGLRLSPRSGSSCFLSFSGITELGASLGLEKWLAASTVWLLESPLSLTTTKLARRSRRSASFDTSVSASSACSSLFPSTEDGARKLPPRSGLLIRRPRFFLLASGASASAQASTANLSDGRRSPPGGSILHSS